MKGRRPGKKGLVHWSWIFWGTLLTTTLVFVAASNLGFIVRETSAPTVDLIDPRYELVEAGAEGWEYHRRLKAGLSGDGRMQSVEIVARVARSPERGDVYHWDDGQPWQVFVRDGDHLTHIFARWVQLGQVSVYVTDEERPRLLIAESQGAGYALYSVEYQGPGEFQVTEVARFPIIDGA